jgi:hypothetical protein
VERVLKGAVWPGMAISISRPRMRPFSPSLPSGHARTQSGHGIIFLQRTATRSWSILSVVNGGVGEEGAYFHTSSNPPPAIRKVAARTLPQRASPLDRVFAELVVATEAGEILPFDLVEDFSVSPSPVLSAAFARFLSNKDPRLVAIGVRGSIASGDPACILALKRNHAALSSNWAWPSLLNEIRFSDLNTGQRAIQILGQVATDRTVDADLRIAVADALARMHTQQSLPYLAALLSDPNSTLRGTGVGGMSSFANNVLIGSHEPAPGAWPYRTSETIAHIGFDPSQASYWQNWWTQNKSRLAP